MQINIYYDLDFFLLSSLDLIIYLAGRYK